MALCRSWQKLPAIATCLLCGGKNHYRNSFFIEMIPVSNQTSTHASNEWMPWHTFQTVRIFYFKLDSLKKYMNISPKRHFFIISNYQKCQVPSASCCCLWSIHMFVAFKCGEKRLILISKNSLGLIYLRIARLLAPKQEIAYPTSQSPRKGWCASQTALPTKQRLSARVQFAHI